MSRLYMTRLPYMYYGSLFAPGSDTLVLMKIYYCLPQKKWGYRLFNGEYKTGLTFNQIKHEMALFERVSDNGHSEDRIYMLPEGKGRMEGVFISDKEFDEIYGEDWMPVVET